MVERDGSDDGEKVIGKEALLDNHLKFVNREGNPRRDLSSRGLRQRSLGIEKANVGNMAAYVYFSLHHLTSGQAPCWVSSQQEIEI